jgi:hypothetical protein
MREGTMHKSSGILLAACLLAATPTIAGDLAFESNGPTWHPAKCAKPDQPESVLAAAAETSGNKMNAMINAYNAYASAAQAYMNCVSKEAEADQKSIDQAITSGAKEEIASVIAESEKLAVPLRRPKN